MPGIHIDGLGPSTDIHCSAENIKVAAFQSKPVMALVKSNSKYANKKKTFTFIKALFTFGISCRIAVILPTI